MSDEPPNRPRVPSHRGRRRLTPGPLAGRWSGRWRLGAGPTWFALAPFLTMVALLAIVIGLRLWARLVTEEWWFADLGASHTWRTVRGTQVSLGLVGMAISFASVWASLAIAQRPGRAEHRTISVRRDRIIRFAAAAFVGLLTGPLFAGGWREWLLWRHGRSFGLADQRFGLDVGFYVFDLPLVSFAVSAVSDLAVTTLLLTAAWYILRGAFGPLFGLSRAIPLPPDLDRRSFAGAHLCALGALVALTWSAEYFIRRYELTWAGEGTLGLGPGYVDERIRMRGYDLMALVALVVAGVLVTSVRRRVLRLPIAAVAGWMLVAVLVGAIVPAGVQGLVVDPDAEVREAPYGERSIAATTAAFGLDFVARQSWAPEPAISRGDIVDSISALRSVAVWDANADLAGIAIRDQQQSQGFTVVAVDANRRVDEGRITPVITGARELSAQSRNAVSWVQRHLVRTHGSGVVTVRSDRVSPGGGLVAYAAQEPAPPPRQQRLYVGESQGRYAVVGGGGEVGPDGITYTYEHPTAGVRLRSLWRRVAFAVRFGDRQLLLSDDIDRSSRVIFVRDVRARVGAIAPFLEVDSDPYLVSLSGGLGWVVETYTTTRQYPHAAPLPGAAVPAGSGLRRPLNYVRNPATAVVDAYTGQVRLYVTDSDEPILAAWRRAVPSAFLPGVQMEADHPGITAQLRYPGDLFAAQSEIYARFRVEDGGDLVAGRGVWRRSILPSFDSIATATTIPGSVARRTVATPNRTLTHGIVNVPGGSPRFGLSDAFASSDPSVMTLAGQLVADAAASESGRTRLHAIELVPGQRGLAQIAAEMAADDAVIQLARVGTSPGARVVAGDVRIVPVGQGVLFVRSFYVVSPRAQPLLRLVAAHDGTRVGTGSSLGLAVARLARTPEAASWIDGTASVPDGLGDAGADPASTDPTVLLDAAEDAFADAEAAVREGDLGRYQERVEEARRLVAQAQEALASAETSAAVPTTVVPVTTRPAG